MRFNEREMKRISRENVWEKEGKLLYKSTRSQGYKERWFRLRGNLFFYYKTDQGTQAELEASGVLVLERCRIQHEPIADRPFVFSIAFIGDGGRQHYFSGNTEKQCEDWIKLLRKASYEELRCTMTILKAKILNVTGQDPMMAFTRPVVFRTTTQASEQTSEGDRERMLKVKSVPELGFL